MDYILFIRAQVDLKPNSGEVMVGRSRSCRFRMGKGWWGQPTRLSRALRPVMRGLAAAVPDLVCMHGGMTRKCHSGAGVYCVSAHSLCRMQGM